MLRTEILFAEFWSNNKPDVVNIQKYFPDADINLYTEADCQDVFQVKNQFLGHYMNDYWKVKRLLMSGADIAIAMDTDVKIVHDSVNTIYPLVKKFGVCLPCNPRHLVKIDTEIGSHSDGQLDDTLGMGHAVNMTPIALDTNNERARELLICYCDEMAHRPVRGPLAMWRAIYRTGITPYMLPPQWCVCAEHVGIGNEIILHVGHQKVREHYGV